MKRYLSLAIVALVLAGCGPATLDGSSEEALRESSKALRESMSWEERERFERAMQVVAMETVAPGGNIFAAAARAQSGEALSGVMAKLDGKTAAEVFAMSDEILAARRLRERAQMAQEIEELAEKKRKAEQAGAQLAKFEVLRSRFFSRPQRFGRPQPIIEITVRNGTDVPVSRAYFEGTIASPGRSIPWLKEGFNYSISGGLEPGEEASWSLAPNMFSDWGKVDAPQDAVLTVVVSRLDGPDGEAAFDAAFSERDANRLEELTKKLAEG